MPDEPIGTSSHVRAQHQQVPEDGVVRLEGRFGVQIMRLRDNIKNKIAHLQGGVPTYFDKVLLDKIRSVQQPNANEAALRVTLGDLLGLLRYSRLISRSRFIRYSDRITEGERPESTSSYWDLSPIQFAATQGISECLSWRGTPLFKSVFDFAMYPLLLWDARPVSIIELGSGRGGSALWLADLLRLFQIDGRVFSVDLHAPPTSDPLVSFIEGDCCRIDTVLPPEITTTLPHPWLIVEDAHVNTLGVLRYFATLAQPGDYIVVEDSASKQPDLKTFDSEWGVSFRVDTRFTDFFGRNSTSSKDSILRRVQTAREPQELAHASISRGQNIAARSAS